MLVSWTNLQIGRTCYNKFLVLSILEKIHYFSLFSFTSAKIEWAQHFKVFQLFSGKSQIISCYKMSINFSFQQINMIILFTVILFTYVSIQKSEKPEWHINNEDAYISKAFIFFPLILLTHNNLPSLYPSTLLPCSHWMRNPSYFFSMFKLNLWVMVNCKRSVIVEPLLLYKV